MTRLYLFFSHKLTDTQKQSATQDLGISDFVSLPDNLQQRFSNVPADLESLSEYGKPILDWFESQARPGDYALIQGDFGLTYILIQKAFLLGVSPVYGTTERKVKEESTGKGEKKIERTFRHERFRLYEQIN